MPLQFANALREVIDTELPLLEAMTDEQSSRSVRPGRWTPKEELGHLLDSAANNHLRIARAALDGEFRGSGYEQDRWIRLHGYAELPWAELTGFWRRYNTMLAHLIARLPAESLAAPCTIGAGEPAPLKDLVRDYILHMRHHLDQLHCREKVTVYGAAAKLAGPPA